MIDRKLIFICLILACSISSAEEIRSDLADGYYVCKIDNETLSKTPRWIDLAASPPLSLMDAIRLATAKCRDLGINDTVVDWTLSGVELRRPKRGGGWYYIASFRSKMKPEPPGDRGRITRGDSPYKKPRELNIPVLMNGKIPMMVEHRHSDRMLELINDLNL